MKLLKKDPDFKFMNKRYPAFVFSALIIIAGALTFQVKGFNLGIDFTGGTMVEVSFKDPTDENDLRAMLAKVGLGKSVIQRVGRDENKFFIKTMSIEEEENNIDEKEGEKEDEVVDALERASEAIRQVFIMEKDKREVEAGKLDLNNISERAIKDFLDSKGVPEEDASDTALKIIDLRKNTTGLIQNFAQVEQLDLKKRALSLLKENTYLGSFTFLSVESVGPQVGHDLRNKAALSTFWALLGMLIYIGFRFKFIYGLAAVITLAHDLLVCLSAILFFNIEVSLTVVAALLTIVGYSLNDTIVIFDRVRDNVKSMRKDDAERILDKSINQTLSRTIVTSSTTLCTVLALFLFGGEVIRTFSFTRIVGIIVGTYSSIFQSCAWLKIWEKYFLRRKKI